LRALGVQGHSASGVERVHWTFLGLSSSYKSSSFVPRAVRATHAMPLQPGLARMKGKNLSHHFGANRRLFLLLFTQLAANSGEGFSQISFHTFRVAERRIKDGLHLASSLRCQIHRYSTSFADACCKRRSISDQIAKVQPLTANTFCPSLGKRKKRRRSRLSAVILALSLTICHTLRSSLSLRANIVRALVNCGCVKSRFCVFFLTRWRFVVVVL
jgi:hypothetical protein